MGRTLHYRIKGTVDRSSWEKIYRLEEWFVKNFVWTCEEPGFLNLSFYPRWPDEFRDSGLPAGYRINELWEIVTNEYDKLRSEGFSKLQAVDNLLSRKMIAMQGDNPDVVQFDKAHGFTKVAGNEFNAMLVTAWLTAVSRVVPGHDITLHDEGEFLVKPLVIRNGLARSEYGKVWREVGTYCRPIDPKDFLEHPKFVTVEISVNRDGSFDISGDTSQIMAGFYGEYFNKGSDKSIDMVKVINSYVEQCIKQLMVQE